MGDLVRSKHIDGTIETLTRKVIQKAKAGDTHLLWKAFTNELPTYYPPGKNSGNTTENLILVNCESLGIRPYGCTNLDGELEISTGFPNQYSTCLINSSISLSCVDDIVTRLHTALPDSRIEFIREARVECGDWTIGDRDAIAFPIQNVEYPTPVLMETVLVIDWS